MSPLASICQLAQSFLQFSRIFLIDCYLSWLIAQNAPVNMSTMACNPLIWLTYHLLISVYIHASLLLFVNLISTVVSVGRILNTSFNPPIVYLSTAIQPLIHASYFSSQASLCVVLSLCRSPGIILSSGMNWMLPCVFSSKAVYTFCIR